MAKKNKFHVPPSRPVYKICSQGQVENIINTIKLLNGEDIDYRKIFCIGFNKTGTTSLHSLFESLGFEAMDGPHWRKTEDWHIHYQFQTFTDGPPSNFAALDYKFPNSLFILNVRNLDEWLDSRVEHIKFRMAAGNFKPKGHWRLSEKSIRHWVLSRQTHHLNVLNHFKDRPESLLVINYIKNPRAADIICRFIKKQPVPSKPYVRSTPAIRDINKIKNQELLDHCYSQLGLSPNETSNDLLCPTLMALETSSQYPNDTKLINYDRYL